MFPQDEIDDFYCSLRFSSSRYVVTSMILFHGKLSQFWERSSRPQLYFRKKIITVLWLPTGMGGWDISSPHHPRRGRKASASAGQDGRGSSSGH